MNPSPRVSWQGEELQKTHHEQEAPTGRKLLFPQATETPGVLLSTAKPSLSSLTTIPAIAKPLSQYLQKTWSS